MRLDEYIRRCYVRPSLRTLCIILKTWVCDIDADGFRQVGHISPMKWQYNGTRWARKPALFGSVVVRLIGHLVDINEAGVIRKIQIAMLYFDFCLSALILLVISSFADHRNSDESDGRPPRETQPHNG
jgi:hypothetical protein